MQQEEQTELMEELQEAAEVLKTTRAEKESEEFTKEELQDAHCTTQPKSNRKKMA
jgi:hypothetical protein